MYGTQDIIDAFPAPGVPHPASFPVINSTISGDQNSTMSVVRVGATKQVFRQLGQTFSAAAGIVHKEVGSEPAKKSPKKAAKKPVEAAGKEESLRGKKKAKGSR